MATWSNKQNGWLNVAAQLLEGLLEVLFSVDGLEVGVLLQVWQQKLGVLVVETDLLGENGRSLITTRLLVHHDHTLLADIL